MAMKGIVLPAEILARFRSLSLDKLEKIEAAWATLTKGEGNAEIEANAQHELHTLKGDARVVGLGDINRLSHKLEELLATASRMHYRVPEDFDLVVTMAIRFMAMLLRKKEGAALGGIDVDGFVLQIDDVLADARARSVPPPSQVGVSVAPKGVSVEALDRVSPTTQHRLAEGATAIFLEQLRSRGAARARLCAVWRSLCAQISAFYAVPLESLLARHMAATEALARDLGKEARASIDADDVWLRIDAAEAVDTAVLHALRNAVDHGLEDPDARRQSGKTPIGEVRVAARALDALGWVEVIVEDDGRGVDLEQVRARGEALGFLPKEAAASRRASEEELLELLMKPGFSTRTSVSDVSGRGIGLDAVRAALHRLGGTITMVTRRGEGTRVEVRVPQASRRLKTRAFRALGSSVTLAVHESWSVSIADDGDERALDVIDLLEALNATDATEPLEAGNASRSEGGGEEEPGVVLLLERGKNALRVRAGGPPFTCTVERLCPTGDEHPVEVVLVKGGECKVGQSSSGGVDERRDEALLVRPDRLLSRRGAR
jgi:two-component system chemotaxis sensor kinase CheA